MLLWNLLTQEISELDRQIVRAAAYGGVEEHSRHLPVATDSIIVEGGARRLEQELSEKIPLLPTSWLTWSRHHMDFASTLPSEIDTFLYTGEQIAISLAEHGFRNFVLLNSHGGNFTKVSLMAEKLHYHRRPTAEVAGFIRCHLSVGEIQSIPETSLGGMGHGGDLEVPLMIVFAPELV